jgi:hypothetical protein
MPGSLEIPELHVEARDDLHTVAELLQRHGVDMAEGNRPVQIAEAGDVDSLLKKIPIAIAAATSRPVGFILDIDLPISHRWAQVRARLLEANVESPDACPPHGFLGNRTGYPSRVGVWLMPDCTSDSGELEDLIATLIPPDDKIWPHAKNSTDEAKQVGAVFRPVDRVKAYIFCWLAWQHDPRRPFGTAIKAKFFNHDSPQALDFLRWLKRLYDIAQLTSV